MSAATQVDVEGGLAQLDVIMPVGIGVVVGVVAVANPLRFLLHRYEKATLGVLLGLLLVAPAGLYPFREGVPPQVADMFEGELVTEENVAEFATPENAKDWPQHTFKPNLGHIGGSLLRPNGDAVGDRRTRELFHRAGLKRVASQVAVLRIAFQQSLALEEGPMRHSRV